MSVISVSYKNVTSCISTKICTTENLLHIHFFLITRNIITNEHYARNTHISNFCLISTQNGSAVFASAVSRTTDLRFRRLLTPLYRTGFFYSGTIGPSRWPQVQDLFTINPFMKYQKLIQEIESYLIFELKICC